MDALVTVAQDDANSTFDWPRPDTHTHTHKLCYAGSRREELYCKKMTKITNSEKYIFGPCFWIAMLLDTRVLSTPVPQG